MKSISVLILFFAFISVLSGQVEQNSSHPFSNSWVISGEGGITVGGTDFPDVKIDYLGRGSLEYFLPTNSSSVFGIRAFAGGGYVAGKGLSSSSPEYLNIDEFRTKIIFGGLGLVYSLSLGKIVQPYLFAGASYLLFDPLKTDGKKMPRNFAGDYATDDKDYIGELGIRFLISNRISLNVGYSLNYLVNDNIDDIFSGKYDAFHSLFGGISLSFSSSSDSDGDGVKDSKDMCNNTPKGVIVDDFGCPKDSDNDGVADYLDKCPETDANVMVDENGCEKLILQKIEPEIKNENLNQEETEIEKNNKVDEEKLILVLNGTANFESGKAELLKNPKSGLDRLSSFMKKNHETKWVIEGHTDNLGDEQFNMKLSFDRANSVLNYFEQNGISKNRFEVLGSGSSKPVADNAIEFGRALNRRVIVEEKKLFEKRKKLMLTVQPDKYNLSNEFNIESLIFTDGTYYCIQVSSWQTKSKAEKEVQRLIENGHSAFVLQFNITPNDKDIYRVRIGFFDNLNGAKNYLNLVR